MALGSWLPLGSGQKAREPGPTQRPAQPPSTSLGLSAAACSPSRGLWPREPYSSEAGPEILSQAPPKPAIAWPYTASCSLPLPLLVCSDNLTQPSDARKRASCYSGKDWFMESWTSTVLLDHCKEKWDVLKKNEEKTWNGTEFTKLKRMKPKRPSGMAWINNFWHIHSVKHYLPTDEWATCGPKGMGSTGCHVWTNPDKRNTPCMSVFTSRSRTFGPSKLTEARDWLGQNDARDF